MNEFYNKLKYFEETEGVPKKVYYHYTSLEALYEIIRTRTFRLMSLKSSNDKQELFYKPEQFITDIDRLGSQAEKPGVKEFWGLLSESIQTHRALFMKETRAKTQPYALCLSSKNDNLTHWDRYANGCKGVNIGFNVNAFRVLYKRMASQAFGNGCLDLGNALYSQEEIDKKIKQQAYLAFRWLDDLRQTTSKDDICQVIRQSGYIAMVSIYFTIMKFAKKSAFLDEDEFRIYHDPRALKDTLSIIDGIKGDIDDTFYQNTRKNFLELVKLLNMREENFAITKTGIRGYRNLCLDEIWGSGVIPEIVLGPLCVQNKRELQKFLKHNGLEGTKVTISNVPLR